MKKKPKINLPVWDFPHFGDYRCCICPSREGPFFEDSCGKKGIDFLCQECHNEVVEVRSHWNMVDQIEGRSEDILKGALTRAVTGALQEVGLVGFKKTSLFMSDRKAEHADSE